jgi:hypothetical protein
MKKGGLIALVLMLFFVAGCSSDPYEKYLGLWERANVRHYEVMEIVKDGDTLLLNQNILSSKDFYGNKIEPMVLKKSDGQLSVDTGLGSLVFGLSGDKSVLRVGNMSYRRIDNDRLNIIKADIKKKEQEREQAKIEREKKVNEERIAREKIRLKEEQEFERRKKEIRIAEEKIKLKEAEEKRKCDLIKSEIDKKMKVINTYRVNRWNREYAKLKAEYRPKLRVYKNCRYF